MHILITGAAGMIGRKLTARLVKDGRLNGQADRPVHADRRGRAGKARRLFGQGRRSRPPIWPRPASRRKSIADRPEVIFHLAGVVSGEAETDFEKGYRVNLDGTRALLEAIRAAGDGYKPKVVFTSSIAVLRRAVSLRDPGRIPSHAAHLLRHAKGDQRIAARRLYATRLSRRRRHPPADHLRAAGQAEQGGVRILLRHHPRAARRPGSDAAGRRQRAAYPCQPALGGRLPHPCRRA